ncbi:16S rRNA (adenine(1518)-N(6)/adenine(1519)-N(6))-dimethyltransferase RsmA [Ruminococcus callidus]|uniref:16S rRNA (adenine(1518)-N(6)/adenine(1519)-N(6))- dimethyltransferase RsmA n=1 Tax=Ruminococcus callidus TaxID=40519 RepID=UPI002675EBD4|nr:16S rRNA (adenine(1518)-N(6)/adenine(1519)-N(6))-dimethyltransferase RsmA [uncultured Ruminococcus sp.]
MMINLTDMKTVRSILGRHGFHFSKKLGQNFLIDPSVCPRIAEEGNAAAGYGVLEIGPGIGTLTQQLALRAEKVTSVELDQRLLPILEETVGEFENLHILHGDILQFDVPQLLEQEFAGLHVAVCANLPYYITTPILMHLLESGANIDSITVMVQKEVAEKLQAPVGTRNSGAITAAVNYYGTVEMLFTVPRDSFLPPPNVDSAVIRIDVQKRYADQTRNPQHFFSMLKHGFSQRRKTLVNALSATMHYEKPVLLEALHAMELPETVRMENLTMEQLVELSNRLSGATAEKV